MKLKLEMKNRFRFLVKDNLILKKFKFIIISLPTKTLFLMYLKHDKYFKGKGKFLDN